jgi:hypothetical protein
LVVFSTVRLCWWETYTVAYATTLLKVNVPFFAEARGKLREETTRRRATRRRIMMMLIMEEKENFCYHI